MTRPISWIREPKSERGPPCGCGRLEMIVEKRDPFGALLQLLLSLRLESSQCAHASSSNSTGCASAWTRALLDLFDFLSPRNEKLLGSARADYGVLPCGWLPLDVDTFAMDNGGTAGSA